MIIVKTDYCVWFLSCSCRFYPLQLHRVPPIRNPVDHVRERRRLQGGVDHPHPGAATGQRNSPHGRQLGFGTPELEQVHRGYQGTSEGCLVTKARTNKAGYDQLQQMGK